MAPRNNYVSPLNVLEENTEEELLKAKTSKGPFLTEIVWPQAISISLFLVVGAYIFITFPWIQNYKTAIFGMTYVYASNFGVTMGIHRHFAHKSFQAKKPLKILMLLLFAMAGQYPVYSWVLDHRMHHRFSDKLGDPHNAKRGFFFSHVGWLMVKKDPIFKSKKNTVDMEDIKNDPYVRIFDKNFVYFVTLFTIIIPTLIPIYLWNESFDIALKMTINKVYYTLNSTWSVNSFAHFFGKQTYNIKCFPKENLFVSIITNGEGYHNYHHTFPWDYKACESGKFNVTAYIIKAFSKLGWAYDLKEADSEYIKKIVQGSGDQTHKYCKEQCYNNVTDGEFNDDGSMPREIPYENAVKCGIAKPKQT